MDMCSTVLTITREVSVFRWGGKAEVEVVAGGS